MRPSPLSLKWLEVFQLTARYGSVKTVAQETGLSVSTVSHHLRCLEDALGLSLVDHSKRPMALTAKGLVMLPYVEGALKLLDRALVEVSSGKINETRSLRLGLIEDFDSEIAPQLARQLAAGLPRCAFTHLTRPSHEILDLIGKGDIDVGVATQPVFDVKGVIDYPLLRDPFVLAVPVQPDLAPEDYLEGRSGLPLLRYSDRQIIGARIETQLRRLRLNLPNKFEFESNQSLLGFVADGEGWAITTPTNYGRAQRFQSRVRLLPFPGRGFARYISIYTTETYSSGVIGLINAALRQLIQSRSIAPAVEAMPWLKEGFHLLPAAEPTEGS